MAIIEMTFFDCGTSSLLYSQNIKQTGAAFSKPPIILFTSSIINKTAMECSNKSGFVQPPTSGQLWPKFAS